MNLDNEEVELLLDAEPGVTLVGVEGVTDVVVFTDGVEGAWEVSSFFTSDGLEGGKLELSVDFCRISG